MNKIEGVSPISSAATKEGQTRLKEGSDTFVQPQAADVAPSSKVVLTAMAQTMMQAQKLVKDTPDVDEQRVAEIKASIVNGDYQVNAENTAIGLLGIEKIL